MKIITSKDDIKKSRKRFNKNKKKAWRKHIDLTDIDEFQEEQRREARLGGPIEDKPSEDIFSIDVKAADKPKKRVSKRSKRLEKGISSSVGFKPSRKVKDKNTLKCHQFLNGLPGEKAISKKKGIVKQKPCRIIWAALKLSKNTPMAEKKRIQVTTQRRKATKVSKTAKKPVQDDFEKDIWEMEENKEMEMFGEVAKTFMVEPMEYYKVSTKQNKVNIPIVRYQKPSSIPAVVPPKPGASYNPSYLDHQDLLGEAAKQLENRRAIVAKERRMIAKYLPSKKDGITQEEWLQEMSEGIPGRSQGEEYEVEEEESYDADSQTITSRKLPEKKSKQSRRKAKTLQVQEQKRIKKKAFKQLESEVFMIKSFQKEIKKEDDKMVLRRKKEMRLKKEKKFETKKLSRHKFQEEDICVPLPSELSGSLRKIVTLGNPLLDRYKNLQRRNIIDTRVKLKRKQAKTKKILKKDLKADMKGFIESLIE